MAALAAGTIGAVIATTAVIGGATYGAYTVSQHGDAETLSIFGDLLGKIYFYGGDIAIVSHCFMGIASVIDDQKARNDMKDVFGDATPSEITNLRMPGPSSSEAKAGYHEAISRARYFIGIITVEDGSGISYENFSRQLR